jgi:hypothetical protein
MFVCSQTARSHKHTHQLDIGSGWNIQRTKQKRRRRRRRKRKKGSQKRLWTIYVGFSSQRNWIFFATYVSVCWTVEMESIICTKTLAILSRLFSVDGRTDSIIFIFDFIRLALSSYRRILMNCSDMLGGSWDSGAGHPYILGVRSIDPWTRQLAKKRKKKKKIIK